MPFRWLTVIALCVFLSHGLHAQPVTAPSETETEISQPAKSPSREEQLRTLLDTIQQVETEQTTLNRQLKRTADAAEAKQLNSQIEQLTNRLQDLQTSFQALATGGIGSAELQPQAGAAFNWQQELQDVLRPLLDELKRLTERPRAIERLRSERTVYQNRLETTDAAIAHIKEISTTIEDPVVKKALKATLEQWQNHQEDTSNHLERIHTELERLTAPDQDVGQGFMVALQEFAQGRGLNLALALGGFALTYLALAGLGRLVGALMNRGREPGARWMTRVIALCFRGLTLILALLVTALVLYARGDWVLLGLLGCVDVHLSIILDKRYISTLKLFSIKTIC
jgi:predicted  nucleic acid-binding Zn-ribbon protein